MLLVAGRRTIRYVHTELLEKESNDRQPSDLLQHYNSFKLRFKPIAYSWHQAKHATELLHTIRF